MRTTVAAAVACLIAISLSHAAETHAAIRKETRIPAQGLGPALRELAKDRDFQIVYVTEEVNGLQTSGATGQLTTREALTKLLDGTGLVYRHLDDKTITVYPVAANAGQQQVGSQPSHTVDERSESSTAAGAPNPGAEKEAPKSFWKAFRLAQAEAGDTTRTSEASSRGDSSDVRRLTLEEITVTAQKRAEKLQEVPISISVLTGVDLDKSTAQGISEALNRVPGIATTSFFLGGGTQVAVRGVSSSTGLFSGPSPIAYYLDSIPFGLVKSAIAPDATAYDLSRVEVLRGPQGTLYGANALNGVVRVLTADADLDRFELKARTSGSDTKDGGASYRVDTALNVPIVEGKLAARAVVGYQNLGGWIDKPDKKDANDAELRNMRLKVNAQPTDQFEIGLSAWSARSDYGAPPYSADGTRNVSRFDESQTIDYDSYGLKATYDFGALSLSSMTGYLDYASNAAVDVVPGTAIQNYTRLDSRVLSQEIALNSHDAGTWRWSAGAFYRDGEDRLRQRVPGIFGIDEFDGSESYAVFGEVRQRFWNSKFEWTLGLRYFQDDVLYKQNALDLGQPAGTPIRRAEASFHSTTPRAVLTWFPGSDVTAYVSYSEGFRSGYPQNNATLRVVPTFPPAGPDDLRSYEIGSKAELWGGRVAVDAAVYYLDWQDIQERVGLPFGPITVGGLINGKSASGIGTDLGITAQLIDGLQFGLTFSWNDLTMDDELINVSATGVPQVLLRKGDRRAISPEYTAGASLDYAFPMGALEGRFSASGNYTSEQHQLFLPGPAATERIFVQGDSMLIARTSFSVGGERWEATAFVDNANNEQGKPIRQAGNPNWDICVRPRTYGLQFEYRFH